MTETSTLTCVFIVAVHFIFCIFLADGAHMEEYHPDEPAQHWIVEDDRIHNLENPTQVLDIQASDPNPGANILTWDYHGGANQIFSFEYQ